MSLSRRRLLATWLAAPAALLACGRRRSSKQGVIDLFIESDGDFLAFKPDALACPTGARVRLTFHHGGRFLSARHNWVLVYPGQIEAVDKDVDSKNSDGSGARRIHDLAGGAGNGAAVRVA